MHLWRVPLVDCGCFYQYGPCDCYRPSSSCWGGAADSPLCRLPITVHKLKDVRWYRAWWAVLAAREPRYLAELERASAAVDAASTTGTSRVARKVYC